MNAAYDVDLPIETLFDHIEDRMDYADVGAHPKTPEQIVMTGQQLFTETGMFTDDLKLWKRLPAEDRTWTRFKASFSLAHQELRYNAAIGQGVFGQSNNALQGPDIMEEMANFATAAAADRTTVATLSATNNRLSAEQSTSSAALVTALAANATLTVSLIGGGGRDFGGHRFGGQGRGGRGGAGSEPNLRARIRCPTGRFYC